MPYGRWVLHLKLEPKAYASATRYIRGFDISIETRCHLPSVCGVWISYVERFDLKVNYMLS